eukprot:TRINITY_DN4236_c0_g2_i31.p1 TRINITY_DN4236_c0_g2~~TRINITY_DN4236_c0_g2_i31.p1  ORF type:complete len:306 (-),score=34.20 TRINITY_DN4236_c0_g2_i31:828-1745(-)
MSGDTLAGKLRLCSGLASEFSLHPAYFTFYNNSLLHSCVDIRFYYSSYLYHQTLYVPPLSSCFYFSPRTNDTLVVVNEKDLIVGVLVGNGIRVEINATERLIHPILENVKLCFQQERTNTTPNYPFLEEDLFPILDIGFMAVGKTQIVPVGMDPLFLEYHFNIPVYCAFLNISGSGTFFLIARDAADDWMNQGNYYVTVPEQIYLGVVGCIYICCSFFVLVLLWMSWEKLIWLLSVYLAVFWSWRGIHLLILCGSRATILSPALSEPPLIFYFACAMELGISYHIIDFVYSTCCHWGFCWHFFLP